MDSKFQLRLPASLAVSTRPLEQSREMHLDKNRASSQGVSLTWGRGSPYFPLSRVGPAARPNCSSTSMTSFSPFAVPAKHDERGAGCRARLQRGFLQLIPPALAKYSILEIR